MHGRANPRPVGICATLYKKWTMKDLIALFMRRTCRSLLHNRLQGILCVSEDSREAHFLTSIYNRWDGELVPTVVFFSDILLSAEREYFGNIACLVHAGYTNVDDDFDVDMVHLDENVGMAAMEDD